MSACRALTAGADRAVPRAGLNFALFPHPRSRTMPPRTLICGSLAVDTITVFPDRFARHILPEQTHVLSVSFQITEMRREWGGCAGNIAYNLKGLGRRPGGDGDRRRRRRRATSSACLRSASRPRRCAPSPGHSPRRRYIITDLDDNQITAFHPGAMNQAHVNHVSDVDRIGLGIVAPDGRDGMAAHVREFAAARHSLRVRSRAGSAAVLRARS